MNDDPKSDWYSDDPVADADDDVLDRGRFIDGLGAVLDTLRERSSSSVLALIGPWGSGKSSVLSAVISKLKEQQSTDRPWLTVPFNPWYFQDSSSLQAGFFREIQGALPSHASWKKAKDSIAGLARGVAPFGSLLALLGVDASKALAGFAELLESDKGVDGQHRAADAALREVNRPVLVIVDDVDRLDPPELLLLFKLIRLVGRLPNIHYLLAYDEDTLIDVLSRTGLVGEHDPRRPIDYLEKIVQVRLDMPPVRDEQLTIWVDRSLAQLGKNHGLDLTDEMTQRFSSAYFAHIRERLGTPRGVKRYFAQVDAFLAGVREEVDLVDFLIVSWIRSAEPLLYRALVANRGRLVGNTGTEGLGWLTKKRVPAEDKQHWEEIFEEARIAPTHKEGVATVLGQLFPRFAHEWSSSNHPFSGRRSPSGRVSNSHYFDRYFAFAVPAEDLSDQIVRAAYKQIVTKTPGPELSFVEERYASRAELILTKFEDWIEPGSDESVEIVAWLTRNITRLPKHSSIADAEQRARWVGGRLYCQLDEDGRTRVFTEATHSIPELGFFSALSHAYASNRESRGLEGTTGAVDRADHAFASRIAELLNEQIDKSPLDIDDDRWRLLWDWMRIDLASSRKWAEAGLKEHAWPPLDLAARFVSTMYSLGVVNPPMRLGEFDAVGLQKLVNIQSLAASINISPDDENLRVEREMLATDDNRRLAARRGLAQALSAGLGIDDTTT